MTAGLPANGDLRACDLVPKTIARHRPRDPERWGKRPAVAAITLDFDHDMRPLSTYRPSAGAEE
jgi:hypothetical protein